MRAFSPFREIEVLRREIDRVLEQHAEGTGTNRVMFLPGRSARTYPLVNLSEDHDSVYVEALAPGIDAANLEITVLRNTLTVTGVKPAPKDVPSEAYHRSERAAGRFVRTIELPTEVNNEAVTARYQNGLLLITMPKAEAAKPRHIDVALS